MKRDGKLLIRSYGIGPDQTAHATASFDIPAEGKLVGMNIAGDALFVEENRSGIIYFQGTGTWG